MIKIESVFVERNYIDEPHMSQSDMLLITVGKDIVASYYNGHDEAEEIAIYLSHHASPLVRSRLIYDNEAEINGVVHKYSFKEGIMVLKR